jgi:GNAT superfamily N-acetyltransferase
MEVLRDLNDEERGAYFRGIHAIWGGGLDEGRFQLFQRRLADAPEAVDRYRLLGWFEDGRLLSAMKAYDLTGTCARRELRLFGVGAVFTPPSLRRQGHAAAMLRAAMDEYRQRGAQAAILFSDIDVAYYQRLGFRVLESRECSVEAGALPRPSGSFRPALAGDEPQLIRLFAAAREGETRFSLARDGWTLRFQLRRLRELARARGVGEPEWGIVVEGEAAAMIRFGRDTVDVLEAAFRSDRGRDLLLSGLRDCMQRAARQRLRIWPSAGLSGLFEAAERTSAIAMIAPLDETAPLPDRGGPAELALLDHI